MAYQEKQPQPIAAMTVAPGGNRNAKNLPYSPQGTRKWSFGLCGCCGDCGTCLFILLVLDIPSHPVLIGCLATVCPCMVYAQVKHRIEYLNQYGRPDPERGGSGCDGDCMTWFCLQNIVGAGWILQVTSKHRYTIYP